MSLETSTLDHEQIRIDVRRWQSAPSRETAEQVARWVLPLLREMEGRDA